MFMTPVLKNAVDCDNGSFETQHSTFFLNLETSYELKSELDIRVGFGFRITKLAISNSF
jgi:hypothetical protein